MSLALPEEVEFMDGVSALPRDNGELAFAAPWEGRALAMAVALVDRFDLPWDAFRQQLMRAIADEPDRPYYESWAAALETMVVALDLVTPAELDRATPTERSAL